MKNNHWRLKRLLMIPVLLTMLIPTVGFWWAGDGMVSAAQPVQFVAAYGKSLIAPLLIISNSPTDLTEMIITDSSGRMTGYDSSSNAVLWEIPDASYHEEGPIENIETGELIGSMQLYLHDADSGFYRLTVFGTGTGSYTIDISSRDSSGQSFVAILDNTTYPGKVDEYLISYSNTSAKDLTVTPGGAFPDGSLKGNDDTDPSPAAPAEDPDDTPAVSSPDESIQETDETHSSPALSAENPDNAPNRSIWATIKKFFDNIFNTLKKWLRISQLKEDSRFGYPL